MVDCSRPDGSELLEAPFSTQYELDVLRWPARGHKEHLSRLASFPYIRA